MKDVIRKINVLKNHPVCLGIDPRAPAVGGFFVEEYQKRGALAFAEEMSRRLINVAAIDKGVVKVQAAFFESMGWAGYRLMQEIAAFAREKSVHVMLDAKRGDISSTMEAYGKACFDEVGCDSLTVTAYMGVDVLAALEPWLAKGKIVYVVLWSSNPGSNDLQEIITRDASLPCFVELFEKIDNYLAAAGLQSQVGYVIGATNAFSTHLPKNLQSSSWLMPGVGAQGASVDEQLKDLVRSNRSHIVPISRGISGFGYLESEEALIKISDWNEYEAFALEKYQMFSQELSY